MGVEVLGKNKRFTRPVTILKKFGRLGFLAIPMTTKNRFGSWYVAIVHRGTRQTAMLNQARFVSYKRLDRRMGTLNVHDFRKMKEAYIGLFWKQ